MGGGADSVYDLSLIHIFIDEETAPIVRLIFGYALNGHGPNYSRRRVEEEKIPCPTWWNRERGLRNTRTKWEKKDPENEMCIRDRYRRFWAQMWT